MKQSMKQFAKYLLVGVLNTSVGYGIIFSCMYLLGLGAVISNALGYGIGMAVSYTVNRDFTFERNIKGGAAAPRFLLVALLAYGANLGMLLVLIRVAHIHEGVAQVLSSVVYVATSFLGNKFYVFRATAKLPKEILPLSAHKGLTKSGTDQR
jgi:putative flippase GtrA